MADIKKLLGKRIKEIRRERGLSQDALAERVGIEPNNISRIENGRNYPTPENLAKIANALNVTVDRLYFFNHHKDYDEIKSELITALDDEKFARILYKFYTLMKE